MQQSTSESIPFPSSNPEVTDHLTEILRQGARELLAAAVEAEVKEWIEARQHLVDHEGRRQVVRNGYAPPRNVTTSLGPVEVKRPRIHDRRPEDERELFTSKILPPYLRKTASIEELIPWLYLKGISTGDYQEALQAILGPDCPGLSASTVTRLISGWQQEHAEWSKRNLSGKQYVYIWADGIHFNIRLEEDKQCILVLMGATSEGKKELIAVQDGFGEREQSWKSMILDLKNRGLTIDPTLAIADGALGFWAACRKYWPKSKEQRCWVHKTVNILNKLPKHLQPEAKDKIHQIWMADTREEAQKAFDLFIATYEKKYPAATQCLEKDRDELLQFYDFPAEHWPHLRSTNPIESTFATVRLRHKRTKGNGSRKACLAMVFKLCESAQKRWRRLKGYGLIPDVIGNVLFVNGIKKAA